MVVIVADLEVTAESYVCARMHMSICLSENRFIWCVIYILTLNLFILGIHQ